MGSIFSSSVTLLPAVHHSIASSLTKSQLIHCHTLSTCYDPIFDVSLSSDTNTILISDDGRLRLFRMDMNADEPLIELTHNTSIKRLICDQIQDIIWSTKLDRFLVLTPKYLAIYDQQHQLVHLNLELVPGSIYK
jgi:hypothetical protein